MPSRKELDDMQKLIDSFGKTQPQDSNTEAVADLPKQFDDAMATAEALAKRNEKLRKAITGK